MSRTRLRAPFPYFGGKSLVSDQVWPRLGNVDNFIEPFCGSAAMLWARPHEPRIETINDVDCYVPNFWRAVQRDPEQVAYYADWPVSEADLHARHRWLVLSGHAADFRRRMRTDPEYFDAKVAGWWCWGLCCWIGGGWCTYLDGPERRPGLSSGATHQGVVNATGPQFAHRNARGEAPINLGPDGKGNGIHRPLKQQMPHIAGEYGAAGRGVTASAGHKKRPSLGDGKGGDGSKGANKRVKLSSSGIGTGVHRKPAAQPDRELQLADAVGTCVERRQWLLSWFGELSDRLRPVRVCCGDWERVCGSASVTTRLGTTGIFLDPPYAKSIKRMHAWVAHLLGEGPVPPAIGASNRDGNLYASDFLEDADHLVARVHVYCRQRGSEPGMRIVLCGYAGEHDALEDLGWQVVRWKAHGGYGNRSEKGKRNAGRERLWFSPHTLPVNAPQQKELFEEVAAL